MGRSPSLHAPQGSGDGWSSDVWKWSPTRGRWSPLLYGFPKTALYARLTTDDHRPHERYAFWRDTALYDFDAGLEMESGPQGFIGRGEGLLGPTCSFFASEQGAISGERRAAQAEKDGLDDISIGFILSGSRMHAEGDERSMAGAGDFFVYDARRDSELVWTPFRLVHLALRRKTVEAALGGRLPSSAVLTEMLKTSRIGPFLASQMRLLAGNMRHLDELERAGVLQTTFSLANLALRSIAESQGHAQSQPSGELFAAAMRLIETRLSDAKLGPDRIAHVLGCSRATLYRAFAEHDLTIAGVIRETRLARARELIQTMPATISIADIAMRCGFFDPPHFSRSFRAHFGTSPTDLRGEWSAIATTNPASPD